MNSETNLYQRLIAQLNSLIPFLALARQDVFDLLDEHRVAWFSNNPNGLPDAYKRYREQIVHSAFLLGYSYFECFLYDILRECLLKRPEMLSKEKTILFKEVIPLADRRAVLNLLIDKELIDLFYDGMDKKIKTLSDKYNFTIHDDYAHEMKLASLIRNCLIHNSSKANGELSSISDYSEGEEICLSEGTVHSFGSKLRALSSSMYKEAKKNHGLE